MRSKIVEYLDQQFGTSLFSWLVPEPAVIYALAMLVGLIVFIRRCQVSSLSRYHALGAGIWAMVGGLVGARAFHLVLHLEETLAHPSLIFDVAGPTTSAGAYFGGGIAFWLYFVRRDEQWLRYADVLASCLGLGPLIGRWSCFLNGDDFGTLSNLPWAVTFPHGSLPFAAQVKAGLLDPLMLNSLPVHPVQLYLSLKGLALLVFFSWLWKNYRLPAGTLFCLYWMVYALVRFCLEYFRGDVSRGFVGIFSVPQMVCMVMFFSALGGGLYLWTHSDTDAGARKLESAGVSEVG